MEVFLASKPFCFKIYPAILKTILEAQTVLINKGMTSNSGEGA